MVLTMHITPRLFVVSSKKEVSSMNRLDTLNLDKETEEWILIPTEMGVRLR